MDERRKALEAFSKQLMSGDERSGSFIDPELPALGNKALASRNLAEDALANEVLKNTGVPIPDKGASRLKQEDFMNRLMKERFPELEPDVRVADLSKHEALGLYLPDKNIIGVDKKLTSDPIKSVSTLLHEGGHAYDNKVLGYDMPDELLKSKSQMDIKGMYKQAMNSADELDPTQLLETAAKGHHARIPNLRDADSFGLGALKSMLKSGTFRGIAPVVAKAGLATAGGLASLASEASDSEDVGSSTEQNAFLRERDEMVNRGNNMKNGTPIQQEALKKMYEELDSGQAFNVRRDALRKMSGK